MTIARGTLRSACRQLPSREDSSRFVNFLGGETHGEHTHVWLFLGPGATFFFIRSCVLGHGRLRSEPQLSGHRSPYSRHHPHRATSDVGRAV